MSYIRKKSISYIKVEDKEREGYYFYEKEKVKKTIFGSKTIAGSYYNLYLESTTEEELKDRGYIVENFKVYTSPKVKVYIVGRDCPKTFSFKTYGEAQNFAKFLTETKEEFIKID